MSDSKILNRLNSKFGDDEITLKALYAFYSTYDNDLNESTFRWRVYKLKEQGVLYNTSRGVYRLGIKEEYSFHVNSKMKEIHKILEVKFPHSELIIWNSFELSNMMVHQPSTNLTLVEVDTDSVDSVYRTLDEAFENVYIKPDKDTMKYYIDGKDDVIVVKKLLVEAPIDKKSEIPLPKIEKIIVDLFVDKELFKTYQGKELVNIYTELFGKYSINSSTLRRYLNRRKSKASFVKFIRENSEISLEV